VSPACTLDVADDDHPPIQASEADPARLAVITALVLDPQTGAGEHNLGVCKVQTAIRDGPRSLERTECDTHPPMVRRRSGNRNH
jgi:hypothetical protein